MDEMTTLEVLGCEHGFWACALENWGGEIAAFGIAVAFILACVGIIWLMWARGILDDQERQTPRETHRLRLVAGPELQDGSWVRLVEASPGHLRAEIFVERTWRPLYREPSRFFAAAMRSRHQLGSR